MDQFETRILPRRRVGDVEVVHVLDSKGKPVSVGGGLRKKEVVLNHDAILALPEPPYAELISPTQTPDNAYLTSFPVVIAAVFQVDIADDGYGNFHSTRANSLHLCWGADGSYNFGFVADLVSDDLAKTVQYKIADMRPVFENNYSRSFGRFMVPEEFGTNYTITDNGIYLRLNTPMTNGPLTNGNPSNQLKVCLWYDVVDLVGGDHADWF